MSYFKKASHEDLRFLGLTTLCLKKLFLLWFIRQKGEPTIQAAKPVSSDANTVTDFYFAAILADHSYYHPLFRILSSSMTLTL
ncbi:MAG: hypothetical protein WAW52_09180 [Methanothrix sp.]